MPVSLRKAIIVPIVMRMGLKSTHPVRRCTILAKKKIAKVSPISTNSLSSASIKWFPIRAKRSESERSRLFVEGAITTYDLVSPTGG